MLQVALAKRWSRSVHAQDRAGLLMTPRTLRVFLATGDRVRDAVRAYVNIPCWTFGGASLWDVQPDAGRANLRPITRLEDIALLDVSGDFGHAILCQCRGALERLDADSYDVLILSEQPLSIEMRGR